MRQRQIFSLLVHSPDDCKNQGWARLKPGTRNSIWVTQMSDRDLNIQAVTGCLPWCISRKLDQKRGIQDSHLHPSMGCRGHKQWLILYP